MSPFTHKGHIYPHFFFSPEARFREFRITDTGIWISDEALLFIFGCFRQVNGSEKRSGGGVALGRHIVKKFLPRSWEET
jgi:signal transduction histidine kinase